MVLVAGRACADDKTLLGGFDPLEPAWFDILEAALERDPESWRGVPPAGGIIDALIGRASVGEEVPDRSWTLLARTPLGDLTEHPRRADVWRWVPTAARVPFLETTAEGWLRHLAQDPEFDTGVEPELEAALVGDGPRTRFLDRSTSNGIAAGARYFARFGRLTERQFLDWLDRIAHRVRSGDLPESAGNALGHTIAARNWRAAAAKVAREAVHRRDFRSALAPCHGLIGWFERWSLLMAGASQLPPPTEDELWLLLEDAAVNLYPSGPEHDEIWSRAGASLGRLPRSGNGRALWHGGLRGLRNGGAGTSPGRLVAEMLRDFPGNDRLRWLAAHRPFNVDR